jgi:flagellar basal-body rod modification protein FlgD
MTSVDSTTRYTTTTSTAASSSSTSSAGLASDFNTFLSLLTVQLQNQNPLDPMDTNEFTSQLVQYAEVEQQIETNSNLESIYSSLSSLSVSTALSYVGSEVTIAGETAPLSDEGIDWLYDLDEDAESVTLTITDQDGKEIWSADGETDEGLHSFTWDGTDSDGNPVDADNYTLTVTALDSDDKEIGAGIGFTTTVSAVDTSDGDITLELEGLMRVSVDAVQKIES